jgi:hypothetical protein
VKIIHENKVVEGHYKKTRQMELQNFIFHLIFIRKKYQFEITTLGTTQNLKQNTMTSSTIEI